MDSDGVCSKHCIYHCCGWRNSISLPVGPAAAPRLLGPWSPNGGRTAAVLTTWDAQIPRPFHLTCYAVYFKCCQIAAFEASHHKRRARTRGRIGQIARSHGCRDPAEEAPLHPGVRSGLDNGQFHSAKPAQSVLFDNMVGNDGAAARTSNSRFSTQEEMTLRTGHFKSSILREVASCCIGGSR